MVPGGGMLLVTVWGEKRSQGVQRYRVTSPRTYEVDLIAFDQPTRTEHIVRIVDISVIGVGIESSRQIDPGLICFKEQVGGQKYGVLIWSKLKNGGYRAGIQFVVLSPDEEAYLQQQVQPSPSSKSLMDPDKAMASLLESIKSTTYR
jgi:hypothetical protein